MKTRGAKIVDLVLNKEKPEDINKEVLDKNVITSKWVNNSNFTIKPNIPVTNIVDLETPIFIVKNEAYVETSVNTKNALYFPEFKKHKVNDLHHENCSCSIISDSSLQSNKKSLIELRCVNFAENITPIEEPTKTQLDNGTSFSIDDSRDKDFNIDEFIGETSSEDTILSHQDDLTDLGNILGEREPNIDLKNTTRCLSRQDKKINIISVVKINSNQENVNPACPLSQKIRETRNRKIKKNWCRYCETNIISKNFIRHLERNHTDKKDVIDILAYPKNSKERRQAISLFRNETNFNLYITGTVRPKRQTNNDDSVAYYPCAFCKGLFNREYLKRHAKTCIIQEKKGHSSRLRTYNRSQSQTAVACSMDPTNTISLLNIKDEVFNIMRGDDIALEAKKDALIVHYGDSYLKSQKRERKEYSCSNRIREVSPLLIAYRNITLNKSAAFKDLLYPQNFENVVSSVREIAGYDPVQKTYTAPSLALHMGTSLKIICDELNHLILKKTVGFECASTEAENQWRKDIKNFKYLVQTRWNTEVSSVAQKDLQSKKLKKPLLLPLVSDVKKFREEVLDFANKCEKIFDQKRGTTDDYRMLVDCTLCLLILFNRRRIGDVQYLKIEDYLEERKTNFEDFEKTLSNTEKMLTTKYKRVVNTGKGSREVVILVPQLLQKFIETILNNRNKYIEETNTYLFAIPKSRIKWGQGDVAFRRLTQKMKLQNPTSIGSNKLRKHISTVMQILNMTPDETKQFSKFMGHTEKTHSEFYELLVDIYQTAKISKILLMMEKGIPIEFKGKSLTEINFNPDMEYAEEDDHITNNFHELDFTKQLQESTPGQSNSSGNQKNEVPCKSSASDDSESSVEIKHKTIKKRNKDHAKLMTTNKPKNSKKVWSEKEISLIKKHFQKYIKGATYPSGNEIKEFISLTNINRNVAIIKSKIQHLKKMS